MRRILATSLMLAVLSGLVAPACAQTIGIVLMHGKTGSPNTVIDQLATALQSAGYLVDTPEMCWSRRRIYDRPFLDCLTEIDSAIGRLKGRGAGTIVVAGMSQGGDAALAYGARQANLAGIIALAPAAAPERQVGLPDIAQSVAQARALVAGGRGNETASFVDRNADGAFSVSTTATIYLSYLSQLRRARRNETVFRLHGRRCRRSPSSRSRLPKPSGPRRPASAPGICYVAIGSRREKAVLGISESEYVARFTTAVHTDWVMRVKAPTLPPSRGARAPARESRPEIKGRGRPTRSSGGRSTG